MSDCCLTPTQQVWGISWREQVLFHWNDDEVGFVLDQNAKLDFYRASSLQQQSADNYFAPPGHISQSVFAIFINAACLAENQQIPIL